MTATPNEGQFLIKQLTWLVWSDELQQIYSWQKHKNHKITLDITEAYEGHINTSFLFYFAYCFLYKLHFFPVKIYTFFYPMIL